MLMLIVMVYACAPVAIFGDTYLLEVVVDKKEDLYRLVLLMLVLMILIGVYFYVDIYDYFDVDFDV